ncbi:MAG: cell division protein ZapA [Synergistaceae bacterium]|jgi:hypothetical protein|nr:cell division protein ZapA [Synergistaceae bacterium]
MERRAVSLLVGRKSYNLITSMEDEKLKDVYDLLREVVASTDSAMTQDERLFITCMTLANELTSVMTRLGGILSGSSNYEDAEGDRKETDKTSMR